MFQLINEILPVHLSIANQVKALRRSAGRIAQHRKANLGRAVIGILDGRYQAGFCVCLAAYLSSKFKLAFVCAHLDVDIDFFLFVGVGIKAARIRSGQLRVPLETARLNT